MRNNFFLILLLFSLSANANNAEELCNVREENKFNYIIGGINKFLMLSNPMERYSDINSTDIDKRVNELPQLEGNEPVKKDNSREIIFSKPLQNDTPTKVIRVKPETYDQPNNLGIAKETDPQLELFRSGSLSNETKTLFNSIPNGLGIEEPAPQQISLQRESFEVPKFIEPPAQDDLDFEEISIEEDEEIIDDSPRFEITVTDGPSETALDELYQDGLKALSVGQYESAIAIYKRVLKRNKNDRDGLFGLATAYHKAGDRKKARVEYAKLMKIYPDFEDGINNFISLASSEAPEHALEELKQLQKSNPKFPAIFAQKGLIYSKLGDKKQAIKNMAYALKLNPQDNSYKYNLAVLLDEVNKPDLASQLYKELIIDSYAGKDIPVGRKVLQERYESISSKIDY